MADAGSTLTYESLFELIRKEKTADDIQKLDDGTFTLISAYIKDKAHILKMAQDNPNSSEEEREKIRIQINNVRKLVKELIERRMKKVINLAMNKATTRSDTIKGDGLLREENVLYMKMVEFLNTYNKDVLLPVINASYPPEKKEPQAEAQQPPAKEAAAPEPAAPENATLRFIEAIPRFLGEEMDIYGPFQPEDVASLPRAVASVLIAKGKAVEIRKG